MTHTCEPCPDCKSCVVCGRCMRTDKRCPGWRKAKKS